MGMIAFELLIERLADWGVDRERLVPVTSAMAADLVTFPPDLGQGTGRLAADDMSGVQLTGGSRLVWLGFGDDG